MNIILCFPRVGMTRASKVLREKQIDHHYINLNDLFEVEVPLSAEEQCEIDSICRIGYSGFVTRTGKPLTRKIINKNYNMDCINLVKEKLNEEKSYMLISYNLNVVKYLQDNDIRFTVVVPDKNLKYDYIGRGVKTMESVDCIEQTWDIYINSIEKCNYEDKVTLGLGKFLSDYIESIDIRLK